MSRFFDGRTGRKLGGLAVLAFALLACTAGGREIKRAVDAAGGREVQPALVSAAEGSFWRPGTDRTLLREIAQAAREIKARLANLAAGKRTVIVGGFTCPTNANATGGALLRHLLSQELKKAAVAVGSSGGVGVSGKFRNVTDSDSGRTTAKITFELEDEEGEKVGKPFSHVVMSERVIADLFGATTPLDPQATPQERSVVLARSIRTPSVSVEGARVYSRKGNKFAVEVLAVDAPRDADADLSRLRYQSLRSTNKGGLAFVAVQPRQYYAVRLLNGSNADVATTLSIDGLSLFTLSEDTRPDGQPYNSHLLVPAGCNTLIKGWFLTPGKTSLFATTGFGQSVAKAKGGSVADVGTITATFSPCPKPKPMPVKSAPKSKGGFATDSAPDAAPSSPAATGKGPTIRFWYGFAKRGVGAIQDTISVRYVWASGTPASKSEEP